MTADRSRSGGVGGTKTGAALFAPNLGSYVGLEEFKVLTKLKNVTHLPADSVFLLNPEGSIDARVFRLAYQDGTTGTLKVFNRRASGRTERESLVALGQLVCDDAAAFAIAKIASGPYDRSYYLTSVCGRDVQSIVDDLLVPSSLRIHYAQSFATRTNHLIDLIHSRATRVKISWARGEPLSITSTRTGRIKIVCPLGIHFTYNGRKAFTSVLPSNVIVDAYNGSMTLVDTA